MRPMLSCAPAPPIPTNKVPVVVEFLNMRSEKYPYVSNFIHTSIVKSDGKAKSVLDAAPREAPEMKYAAPPMMPVATAGVLVAVNECPAAVESDNPMAELIVGRCH